MKLEINQYLNYYQFIIIVYIQQYKSRHILM